MIVYKNIYKWYIKKCNKYSNNKRHGIFTHGYNKRCLKLKLVEFRPLDICDTTCWQIF